MGLECDLSPSPHTGPPLHMGKKDLFFYMVMVCTGMLSWGLHVFAQPLRQPRCVTEGEKPGKFFIPPWGRKSFWHTYTPHLISDAIFPTFGCERQMQACRH